MSIQHVCVGVVEDLAKEGIILSKVSVSRFDSCEFLSVRIESFGRESHCMNSTIYEAAGGRQAFIALAHAWHARCLADPIVSHAFSHGYHPKHSERLAAYWAEALGGPSDYTASMGSQSVVVRMHSGKGEHAEMDERAQVCFAQALDDAGLPDDPRLRAAMKAYFRWATQAMSAYPDSAQKVPIGLALGRWSWHGPV
jgi:hemoglobin